MADMWNFKGKKVVIMGLGLYEQGSGISAARFFIRQAAKVLITDLKSAKQLAGPVKKVRVAAKKYKNSQVNFVLGQHRVQDFKAVDLILRNPGVPAKSKFLQLARQHKIPIYTDISLFLKLYAGPVLGVTGTRGKSTTTTLLYNLIKSWRPHAVLGGNLGQSPLLKLTQLKTEPMVLELSSWMTESLIDIKRSPCLAVVTNIYPDHFNTYHGLPDYVAAKEPIWRYQKPTDLVVLNLDNPFTKKMGQQVKAKRFWVSAKNFVEQNGGVIKNKTLYFRQAGREQQICSVKELRVIGQHNVINVLTAATAALAYGVPISIVREQVKKFRGIANRLELVKTKRGIKFYNDTTATTPDATIAALRSLGSARKNIVLIAGGSDKGLDFTALAKLIPRYVKSLILLPGKGTDRLKLQITNFKFQIDINSMKQAAMAAIKETQRGDIILLSPACASFGLFLNEADRGRQFLAAIKRY